MNVIFDTSTDWLALQGSQCANCRGNKFDSAASATSVSFSGGKSERKYNDVVVQGTEWLDTVCLNRSTCIESFEFYLISQSDNILAK